MQNTESRLNDLNLCRQVEAKNIQPASFDAISMFMWYESYRMRQVNWYLTNRNLGNSSFNIFYNILDYIIMRDIFRFVPENINFFNSYVPF